MNIINILNTQCIQHSVELPYRGDTPVLNPGSLLDILISELPSLFKDIMKDLGFDVSNWPDSFHISENSEDPLLTIIYPSLTGNGRTIDDILAHTKGPVLILDPNPIYSPSLGHGRKIVGISMADLAIEILRRIGGYSVSPAVGKRIEELCKVWILIGVLYQGTDLNKPFGEQPRVRYNIPFPIKIAMSAIERGEVYRRIKALLEEKLRSEINSGDLTIIEKRGHNNYKSHTPFTIVFYNRYDGPWKVSLLQRANDIVISHRFLSFSDDVRLLSEISTTDSTIQHKLQSNLQRWKGFQRHQNSPNSYVFEREQDVTRRTLEDVVDEIVIDICDVVTGKTVY